MRRAVVAAPDGEQALKQVCSFYNEHALPETSRTISQYISLALNTTDPPFATTVKEADLPPDASAVLGFLPVLQRFYDAIDMGQLWLKYEPEYEAYVDRFSDPIHNMITATDAYLRMPLSDTSLHRYSVFIEPLIAPGQVNARNYGADYFMVMSPQNGQIRIEDVRHTYLHYLLDEVAMRRAPRLRRFNRLLDSVQNAPLDEPFKNDVALLATESFIRAVEVRLMTPKRTPGMEKKTAEKLLEEARDQKIEEDMQQGFVLTKFFNEQLEQFEKEDVSIDTAFPDFIVALNLEHEEKRAAAVKFSSTGSHELVRNSVVLPKGSLAEAEQKLASGDPQGAAEIARKVVDENSDDPAHAMFILARAASMSGAMAEARTDFESTLQLAHDPRILAWSHIYLGRIFDIQNNREQALRHYNAALNTGDSGLDTRAAAERGLQQPFKPPVNRQTSSQQPQQPEKEKEQ